MKFRTFLLSFCAAACLCFWVPTSAHAQSPNILADTLRWNTTGFTDMASSEAVSTSCQFISYGDQRLEWIQGEGALVIAFQVTGTSGTWLNLEESGSLSLSITFESLSGQITFARNGADLTATLTLSGGTVPINNSYQTSNFEKL